MFPSARAAITFPSAERDLLMFLASSNTAPSAPVLLTYDQSLFMVRSFILLFGLTISNQREYLNLEIYNLPFHYLQDRLSIIFHLISSGSPSFLALR